uniref:Uncharacterized protein n=1 Tax=Trichogramma kaykai TaxID=54128 RepID=A0ABD2XIC0_9HYME
MVISGDVSLGSTFLHSNSIIGFSSDLSCNASASLACTSYNENSRRSPRHVCVFTHVCMPVQSEPSSSPSSSAHTTDHRRDGYSTRNYVVPQVIRAHIRAQASRERKRERETRNDGEVPVICQCPNKGMRLFPRGAAATVYKLLYVRVSTRRYMLHWCKNQHFYL